MISCLHTRKVFTIPLLNESNKRRNTKQLWPQRKLFRHLCQTGALCGRIERTICKAKAVSSILNCEALRGVTTISDGSILYLLGILRIIYDVALGTVCTIGERRDELSPRKDGLPTRTSAAGRLHEVETSTKRRKAVWFSAPVHGTKRCSHSRLQSQHWNSSPASCDDVLSNERMSPFPSTAIMLELEL